MLSKKNLAIYTEDDEECDPNVYLGTYSNQNHTFKIDFKDIVILQFYKDKASNQSHYGYVMYNDAKSVKDLKARVTKEDL